MSSNEGRKFPFWLYFLIPVALLVIALISRIYDLSGFPYFHMGMPTCGGSATCNGTTTVLPGLYDDEVQNLLLSRSSSFFTNIASGPIVPSLINLFTRIFGVTAFAARFPFAVSSALSALVVYFTTRKMAKGFLPAILSSAYFIVMMPALVYGRMALAENLVALFFILTFYSTMKVKELVPKGNGSGRKWLLASALLAALSMIIKLNGAVVPVYFVVFLFKNKLLKKAGSYIGIMLTIAIILPLALLQASTGDAYKTLTAQFPSFFYAEGNQLALFHFFFLDTLPSGISVFWSNASAYSYAIVVPEFWYIFLYICLGVLLVLSFKEYSELLLALGIFVVIFATFPGGFGAYTLLIIQPLLAIAFGPGLKKLLNMPIPATLVFYAAMFVPLAESIGIYLIAPLQIGNTHIESSAVFFWNLSTIMPMVVLLLLSARWHESSSEWRTWINAVLMTSFFVALLSATFFIPVLYPYYI